MLLFLNLFIIILGGVLLKFISTKIKVPALIGYLLLGILINALGLIDPLTSQASPYIRKIALVIILIKAGLSLDISDLKKVGRPAILISFLPAVTEMTVIGLLAPLFFNITYVESFILGSVLGAVSPAVVIPMMTFLIDKKKGTNKGVPQLVLAGSSIDDIIMIVFYQAFISLEEGVNMSFMTFANIFIAIISGTAIGIALGFLIALIFKKIDAKMNRTLKFLLILGVSLGLVAFEEFISKYFLFSSLLAIISMCVVIRLKNKERATRIASKATKTWVLAEMFLFFLVGASIKIEYATKFLLPALLLLAISLVARSIAVNMSLIKTNLNKKERLFITISYLPKATVQASIGGGLLDLGNKLLESCAPNAEAVIFAGTVVLSISVLSILITAPLSSLTMNFTYNALLEDENNNN